MPKLIGVHEIEELLELVFLSAYVAGEQPVSALLLAEVEDGKTTIAKSFVRNDGVEWITDVTAFGIAMNLRKEIISGSIRHLVFGDLLLPLSHKREVREPLLNFLNAMVEEGIGNIFVGPTRIPISSPYGCGIVACLPIREFFLHRDRFERIGFISRMLPISWSYSPTTVQRIAESIMASQQRMEARHVLTIPSKQQPIALPSEMAERLWPLAQAFGAIFGSHGFRYLKHFERLACASALQADRRVVNQADVDRVLRLSRYCNLDAIKV